MSSPAWNRRRRNVNQRMFWRGLVVLTSPGSDGKFGHVVALKRPTLRELDHWKTYLSTREDTK